MDLALLITFLEVSKTRHFGRAAANLYLTQSAVSFRIKQLEDVMGVALFTRQRNNIMLTPSGERLISHAENILAAWQVALQDVGVSEQQETQLVLGGISNLWDTFLQSLLPKLAQAFPTILIRTEINSHLELSQALLANRVDIAVVLDPPLLSELSAVKIGTIELVLVSSDQSTKIETVRDVGYLFVNWGTAFNIKHAKLFKAPVQPILHTEQSQIALEFLLSHGGAAFLPLALVKPYLKSEQLFLVEGVKPSSRAVYAIYSKNSQRFYQLHPVIDLLKKLELKPEATLQAQ